MPAGFNCAYDDEPKPAVLLVTAIATGETEGICADCIHAWGLVMAGVDPNRVDEVLTRYVYPPTDELPEPADPDTDPTIDNDEDETPPAMVDVDLPDLDVAGGEAERAAAGLIVDDLLAGPGADLAEVAHRERVHDELAARPDAARTSADAIPWRQDAEGKAL